MRLVIIIIILVALGIYFVVSTSSANSPQPDESPVKGDWGEFNLLLKLGYYEGNYDGMSSNGGYDLYFEFDVQTNVNTTQDLIFVGLNAEDPENNLNMGINGESGTVYAYVNGYRIENDYYRVNDGGWHHIIFKKVGSVVTLIVDEPPWLVVSGIRTKPIYGKVTIGGDYQSGNEMRGKIKNVMFGTTKIYSSDFKFIKA